MKIKPNLFIMFFTLAAMAFSLVACDTRPIPGDSILTMLNSDMEETREFQPMDTMYIKVAGMKSNKFYQVSLLDADKKLVTKIETRTNDEGVINPVPLWYDMGLKLNEDDPTKPPTLVWPSGLQPAAFKVNVKSLYDNGDSTNFTQDMWIIFTKSQSELYPKPVVYSCSPGEPVAVKAVDDTVYYPENAFKETGTTDKNGLADIKTKVYVKADRVPKEIKNTDDPVNQVDFYVIKFTGAPFKNGDKLFDTDRFVTRKTADVVDDPDFEGNRIVRGTLLWDLNAEPQLINPNQDNMAYSIVMDVDRDGVYDEGFDIDEDGVADDFIDGIDGNGSPGFIIQNTPANEVFVTITDETGNEVNAISEKNADNKQLNISIDNLPLASDDLIGIYLIDSEQTGDVNFAVPGGQTDVRSIGTGGKRNIPIAEPDEEDNNNFKFLPLLKEYPLVNTKPLLDNQYKYTGGDVSKTNKSLDIVVDIDNDGVFNSGRDIFIKDGITILDVPDTSKYTTFKDANCTTQSQYFNETNTVNGYTKVYLKSEQDIEHDFDVFVFKHKNWQDNEYLSGSMIRTSLSGNDKFMIWDLDGPYQVINPTMANNTYDIVIDNDMDGVYDPLDDDGIGDPILTVVILNTNVNSYPRLSYVNIASGGSFGNTWEQHWTIYSEFCDYRDVFIMSGLDTNPYGAGYGVKAVFNPYFSWFCSPDPEIPIEGLYYGLYVDVYIVNAATFDLSVFGDPDELNDTIDVTGQHSTLVVQPSCYNGAGMMNIWPAEMTPGSYYVIVDVNRDGIINEGVDIIDAVKEDGTTILDDPTVVGFRVE